MTTLEKTISMIKTLPEADLAKVEALVSKLQRKREPKRTEITVEELHRQLQDAEDSFNRGEGIEMGLALEQLREKHNL